MRLTVLNQMAKGVAVKQKGEAFEKELERVKWFPWCSNLYKALQEREGLALDIYAEASPEASKLARALREFDHYIREPAIFSAQLWGSLSQRRSYLLSGRGIFGQPD